MWFSIKTYFNSFATRTAVTAEGVLTSIQEGVLTAVPLFDRSDDLGPEPLGATTLASGSEECFAFPRGDDWTVERPKSGCGGMRPPSLLFLQTSEKGDFSGDNDSKACTRSKDATRGLLTLGIVDVRKGPLFKSLYCSLLGARVDLKDEVPAAGTVRSRRFLFAIDRCCNEAFCCAF